MRRELRLLRARDADAEAPGAEPTLAFEQPFEVSAAVARVVSDRIHVMKDGRFVESGEVDLVPEYTNSLLSFVLRLDARSVAAAAVTAVVGVLLAIVVSIAVMAVVLLLPTYWA